MKRDKKNKMGYGGIRVERTIFHIDVNSAFLSWEAAYRVKYLNAETDLRDSPSAIGGDQEMRRGIILAKSIPAKKYRIQTGETLIEAKRKCPSLYLAPPNYGLYEKCSKAFISLLREYTPDVEQYSIDEAFMDMTGTRLFLGEPEAVANTIRMRIREELGFTVNIGVSDNKLLAKMASEFRKPDNVSTLYSYEIKEKMWPLAVSDLFFVGRATAKKLFSLGIQTIGELAATDPLLLKQHLKKQGEIIWAFANGIDLSQVQSQAPPNKGYGNSTTIAFDVTDREIAHRVLLGLSETVGQRMRKDDAKAEVIAVGIKTYDLQYVSHQMTLTVPIRVTNQIYQYACKLFDELWDKTPIRHLVVHTSRIRDYDFYQMDLFTEMDYEKWEIVDRMVDGIRERYGIDMIKRAVLSKGPIDHMSGGISREKRDVDYSKISIM